MGNYMETCIQRTPTQEETLQQHEQQEKQESKETSATLSKESSTLRVKLVLTKDELEWLMVQLKKDQGWTLEQVLQEIERSRLTQGSVVTKWKPGLESIMESPEIYHHMDRSS